MLVSDIPAHAAHRNPGGTAILFGDREMTYVNLRDGSWQLANALLQIAKPGDRVAILAENCPEYALCYYGVPAAGMALTLLNYRLVPAELAYIIGDAEPSVLIVEAKYLARIESIHDVLPSVHTVVVIGATTVSDDTMAFDTLVARGAPQPPAVTVSDDAMAWLLYTSGTTGLPKGVMLTHRNVMAAVLNSLVSWDRQEDGTVMMMTFPMFHVAGYGLLVSHLRAVKLVLMQNFDPETLFATIQRQGVTATSAAPTMIAMLLHHPLREQYDLSTLVNLGYGASAMPAAVLRRARECWPQVRFGTGFGMTELAGNVMVLSADEHDRAIDEGLPILNSVGRQMMLAMVRVVDDAGRDVVPGEDGEIIVKGDQVLSGYWRNPEATAKAFTDGWFHTGDVGRWDAGGYLTIVDRKKDMIVSGGENVYPREVEEVLYRHSGVLEAAVVGIEDAIWGEKVVAVVSRRLGSNVVASELIGFCRDHIASYKKPTAIAFVDELPKNASGKVLKRELRSRLAANELALEC